MAKPKTDRHIQQTIYCEHCTMPIEAHTEDQFKNYSGNNACKLYSDWMAIVYTGVKHTRDEWLSIIEVALKNKYPDVLD